ncbi:putative TLC domain-containing protein [Lachnellula subtilissima]|uniref:Putative TLC domain-containing protein n=1 Tax=Lachnellula subtilissima TaxID=602034 RepID=A0A8H8U2Q5_9HELO|nr:putative TLC domain-containing protein [Lachnellula subtilissima]
MLDPFFTPFPLFKELAQPLCDTLHLYSLPLHIHEILSAFAVYHIIFEYIAAPLSTALLPTRYTSLSWESKLRWNMHCVSLVQSISISVLALWVMCVDQERKTMNLEERLWGYTGAAGMVQALSTGCLLTYTLGFRPVFNYYGCVFMLYELSTPFLNMHWFFDKLGMTGSKAQLYNGLALVSVFFSCRLVWGAYSSFNIYKDVWDALHITNDTKFDSRPEMMIHGQDRLLPWWLVVLYLGGHVTLQVLNVFWLGRMIAAIRKRFSPKVKVNGKAK